MIVQFRKIPIIAALAILSGCANLGSDKNLPLPANSVANHIWLREATPSRIEFVSGGRTLADGVPADTDPKALNWLSIAEIGQYNWNVRLLVPATQQDEIRTFLYGRPDDSSLFAETTRIEAIRSRLGSTRKLFFEWLGNDKVSLNVAVHLISFEQHAATPVTQWQSATDEQITLNLLVMLPPFALNGGRVPHFDDRRFIADIVRTVVHEYAHIALKRNKRPSLSELAEEFAAHTLDRCAANLAVYRFSNPVLNAQLIAAGRDFDSNAAMLLSREKRPVTETGGALAVLSLAAFFSQYDVATFSREQWLGKLAEYCSHTSQQSPQFATLDDGLEWIRLNMRLDKTAKKH